MRLPGPFSHTPASGPNRKKRVLKLTQRDVWSSLGRLGVKFHMTRVSNFFLSTSAGEFRAGAAGRRCKGVQARYALGKGCSRGVL